MRAKTILSCILVLLIFAFTAFDVHAEGVACESGKNGVSISPVSQPFSITAGKEFDSEFVIKNISNDVGTFMISAAPYTMIDEDYTVPNFSTTEENYTQYTQIARWIRFEDVNGAFVESLNIDVEGCTEKTIKYKVVVPDNIPGGGQYAVILVRSAGSNDDGNIKAVPQVGLLVSARAIGEAVKGAEISEVSIAKTYTESGNKADISSKINAYGLVKNTGNVDLGVKTKLVVKNIFGSVLYENESSVVVLPETTRRVSDVWEDTPFFGLFLTSYTVSSNGESADGAKLLLIMPLWIIVLGLTLLVVIIVWVVVTIKKRRARKARMLV